MVPFAAEFVHRESAGDAEACARVAAAADALLSPLYDDGLIGGYQLAVVEDEEAAADELVPASRVEPLTAGRHPYVFVRVQPVDDEPPERLLAPLGLAPLSGGGADG